jgi:hypothetical protein
MLRDDDDSQMDGIAEFFKSWPARDVKGWETETPELERDVDEGGCWTGGEFWISTWSIKVLEALTRDAVETSSADMFPFVGAVPEHDGQWIAAGFAGHGKPDSTIELPCKIVFTNHLFQQACPESSSQQPTSQPPSSSPSVSATVFQLLPLPTLLCRSLSRSQRKGWRSCKGRILPRGRSLPESGMARVVGRSFVGIRGGCLLMLLWVLEGMDGWMDRGVGIVGDVCSRFGIVDR